MRMMIETDDKPCALSIPPIPQPIRALHQILLTRWHGLLRTRLAG